MITQLSFREILEKYAADFHPVVHVQPGKDIVAPLDLSKANPAFSEKVYESTETLQAFIDDHMAAANATYLIGGYRELRDMYRRSSLFDKNLQHQNATAEEPRSLHLGIDVWGPAGVPVFAPLGGMVHSFANNDNYGDYGATIILQHQLETINFYTLYGHLATRDLVGLAEGQYISRGQAFAHFGPPEENGHWPPHLHFQLILDMAHYKGDFPGVCKPSEAVHFLGVCPNPSLLLGLG